MKHIGACRSVIGNRGVPGPNIPRSFHILVGRLRSLNLSIGILSGCGSRVSLGRAFRRSRSVKLNSPIVPRGFRFRRGFITSSLRSTNFNLRSRGNRTVTSSSVRSSRVWKKTVVGNEC